MALSRLGFFRWLSFLIAQILSQVLRKRLLFGGRQCRTKTHHASDRCLPLRLGFPCRRHQAQLVAPHASAGQNLFPCPCWQASLVGDFPLRSRTRRRRIGAIGCRQIGNQRVYFIGSDLRASRDHGVDCLLPPLGRLALDEHDVHVVTLDAACTEDYSSLVDRVGLDSPVLLAWSSLRCL